MVLEEETLTTFNVLEKQFLLPYQVDASNTKKRILLKATVLFCMEGYEGIRMKELAAEIGLTAGALYNHFSSKQQLWDEVLDHAMALYFLYCDTVDQAIRECFDFESALHIMLAEPGKMRNTFTCYAFNLVQAEQFRNRRAGELFSGSFLEYGIACHKKWFDLCISRGFARPFDSDLFASLLVNTVLVSISCRIRALINSDIHYEPAILFNNFKRFMLEHFKV
jgi:AcrR family transcriptional regulator